MTIGIPHSKIIEAHLNQYIDECISVAQESSLEYLSSSSSKAIFKNSLACFCVLREFSKFDLVLLKAASEIARKTPFLMSIKQYSLAYVELRRYCELIFWYPYFFEHPVELADFLSNPDANLARDIDKPISFAAHRDRSFYANYCKERFAADKSGLAKAAVESLSIDYSKLSVHVHAKPAALQHGNIGNIFENISESSLNKLIEMQKRIFSNGLLVVSVMKPKKISKLQPIERAWFDWLVGTTRAKSIRAGVFGLY